MSQVSVIIPYYKKKKYILATLKSVINQTYKNIEIIIVFDEENKDNLNFIKKVIKLDRRIKLIVNNKNQGAGLSRNIGIKNSKGQYLAFIDADDLWHKTKISKQLQFLKKTKYKICHTSYNIINNQNIKIGYRKARNFLKIDDLIKSCDIGLSTVMLKREILDNNIKFSDLKTKEDFVLWLKLLKKNIKIYGLSKNLAKWRKTDSALSSSIIQKLFDAFRVYNKFMRFNFILSIYYVVILSLNYIIKKFND